VAGQQVAGMLGGPLGAAFILHSAVCASSDHTSLAQLISISLFMSGLCTILQVTFGVRYARFRFLLSLSRDVFRIIR